MQFNDLVFQYRRIQDDVRERMEGVLEHGRFIMGPEVAALEGELAEYVGVKHAIACANGTDALQISLMALDAAPGDEIIMPAFSYFATAEVSLLLKLKPVFVDIDPRTYNIDPAHIAAAITPRTKAIMPVSLFGQCADFDVINAIATKKGIMVIEDGAQSFGGRYKGRRSLSLSPVGCTSFFPSKPLGCYGDGGMCFTDDEVLAQKLRMIRVHGQSKSYVHEVVGVNSRLDTLQAAVLLAKFAVFEDEVERRQAVAARYAEHLAGYVETPYVEPHNLSVYAQYTIATDRREALQKALKAQDIPCNIYYPRPMPAQAACGGAGYKEGLFPHAERACRRVLSLPMHPYLETKDQDRVIAAVREAVGKDKAA